MQLQLTNVDEDRTAIGNGLPTWKRLLHRTTVTLGCTNLFDHDPPRSVDNFPRFIYDPTIVVAADGNSRTVITSGTDAKGAKFESIGVYDKG